MTDKELLVLEILDNNRPREMSGFEIVQKSDGKIKRGRVYIHLQKLKELGLVSSREEEKKNNRRSVPRILFSITEGGIKEIQQSYKNQESNPNLNPLIA